MAAAPLTAGYNLAPAGIGILAEVGYSDTLSRNVENGLVAEVRV
jgi:hypothetical protein